MRWQDFYDFYRIINNDNLSLFYCGDFSDEITVTLIDLSELSFGDNRSSTSIKKKVSFLIAECFQNVIRHTNIYNNTGRQACRQGYFMTRNIGGDYYIASGNIIQNEDIENLQSKINDINILGKNELKDLYMKVLGTEGMSAKGGAGLGLIDMARKSGRKLDAVFKKVNDLFTDFYLQIYIGKEEDEHDASGGDHLSASQAIHLNELLRENKIIMAYQGDFCQESILPILTMIDQNLASHESGKVTVKNLYHTLVEILQNIMHHGFAKDGKTEGVFAIGTDNGSYYVDAANYVSNPGVPALKRSLEEFVAMDTEGLRTVYKKILKEGPKNPDGGAGLGLIDIIRLSRERPAFRFEQEDDEKTLFYINIRI